MRPRLSLILAIVAFIIIVFTCSPINFTVESYPALSTFKAIYLRITFVSRR